MIRTALLAATAMLAIAAPAFAQAPAQPKPATKAYEVPSANGARADEYYWLRDDTRKNAEMLAYLAAENAYTDAAMARLKLLSETLYSEIVGHIKQDDSTVPFRKNGYWYTYRYETGADYPLAERHKGTLDAPAELVFDMPAMAKGNAYFSINSSPVSPHNRLIAWAQDTVGRRQYTLKVKDIATGRVLPDTIENVEPNLVWAGDSKTILYIAKDPTTLRGYRVMAHVLGTPNAQDRLIYEEKDDTYQMGIDRTSDDRFICVWVQATVSSEQRCAPADAPDRLTVVAPRTRDHLYAADHEGERWIIRTNRDARNYRLVTVADADIASGPAAWRDLVPASDNVFIEDFKPFTGFIAIEQREGGNKMIRLLDKAGKSTPMPAAEPAFTMALSNNGEIDTPWVRYTYGSLVTPTTTTEINALTGEKRVLKVAPVPNYDPANYVTERVWATARDGAKIPVSLVYRKGTKIDGTAPLFQYGYGSYGYSQDPSVDPARIALLDRGVVYALATSAAGRKWAGHGTMTANC